MVLSLPRPILCVALSLAGLTTARIFFSDPFSMNEMALSFFFLLNYASRTCLTPRQ